MVKEVEGIVLNFAPGEERNIWIMVIGCIVGFLPFEALTIYQLMYGTDDDGGGGGGKGRANGGGKYIARGSRSDETGSRYMCADSGQSTASNVIAVPGDLEADEPSPPTPSSMATLEHPGPQKDKGDDDISAAYTIGHLPRQMPAVEGLRIIGAVHIVAFHFYLFEHKETQCLPCRLGEWWVHIFFVITGLVSYRSASRQKTTADAHAFGGLRLLERRLKHIYPITFISFVIMYFVRMYNDAYVTSVSVLRILMLSSSWTPPFHDSSVLNGPAWYISNLVPFWLLLPHWARALRRASRKCLFLMLAVLYVGSFAPFVTRYMVIEVPGSEDEGNILAAMCNFSPYANLYHVPMGLILAAMLDRKYVDGNDGTSAGARLRRIFERVGATIGVGGMAALFATYRADTVSMLYKGPLSYPLLYVLFTGTSQLYDISSRLLACLRDLGQFSLPLYILHIPIQRIVVDILGRVPGKNINVNVYYALLLPCSLTVGSVLGAIFQNRWSRYCSSGGKR